MYSGGERHADQVRWVLRLDLDEKISVPAGALMRPRPDGQRGKRLDDAGWARNECGWG